MTARPEGAYRIRGDEVTWVAAADTTRVIILSQVMAIVAHPNRPFNRPDCRHPPKNPPTPPKRQEAKDRPHLRTEPAGRMLGCADRGRWLSLSVGFYGWSVPGAWSGSRTG
jgi:hypothetical protein